jgi:hypothetical protein
VPAAAAGLLLAGCGLFGGDGDVETLNASPLGITVEVSDGASLDDAKEAAREHCRRHAGRPVLGYTAFEGDDRQVAFFECR